LFINVYVCLVFFFFQAEDGIRDRNVTGVQTCALRSRMHDKRTWVIAGIFVRLETLHATLRSWYYSHGVVDDLKAKLEGKVEGPRSEERRVGKECRSRWVGGHERKKRRGIV